MIKWQVLACSCSSLNHNWTQTHLAVTITEPPFCNGPPFCNSIWWAQFCLNLLTSFIGIFCLDVVFTSMNLVRFIIAWRNWNVMIYTAKRCCLILKAFGTVQCSIFCYNYIQSTSLHVLYAIYESRERSEQSCQCSMIFEEGRTKPLEFQSPLTKRVLY
jgi:hypothetical protein